MTENGKPARMDGYIRVSRKMGREGPGYISPDVQREAIERWAAYRGVEIVAWHVDEDESGGTQDRPGMRDFMERMRADLTDGIAVWKFDRFARNVHEAIRDVREMQSRGKHLAAVTEDIDPTGPFGAFILTIMLAVATLQRDNITAGWRVAQAAAVKRGAKPGRAPFGYRRTRQGWLEPDPTTAPIVTRAFTLASKGNLQPVIAYLKSEAPDHRWTLFTVRRLLANRTYLGEVRHGDELNTNAHEALVPRTLFESAQHDPTARRAPKADFPFSGLTMCGACGAPMVGDRGSNDQRRMYRCSKRCKGGSSISADRLEQYLVSYLREGWESGTITRGSGIDTTEAETALLEAEHELNEFAADATVRTILGTDRYHKALDARAKLVREAEIRLRDLLSEARPIPSSEILDSLSLTEWAELLPLGLQSVTIKSGRRGSRSMAALIERVAIVPVDADGAAPPSRQDAAESSV